ncbi:glycosyl transferase family protein [Candidatus Omnitrophus magneticus]|uniref:Glycosyl transferase family protein n=1 Tax=Candidatus Omnitrophus magneticus TaxID=1609969 RepID=A0A0F0CT82_9BACT|nr:glycosyl transferase family protein [Candidatus Omnitrophus magneticus]
MNANLTICLITYNSARYLPELFKSFESSVLKGWELLIVDNNSQDNTLQLLETCKLPKQIINLSLNMGHSYAANIALKSCKTRYLILLDHDTIVDRELFSCLFDAAEQNRDPLAVVFTPKIIDKSRNEVYYGGEFHFIGKTYTNREMPRNLEVGMIPSTAPLLDLKNIPKNILFDEDFFIYWNDADFFYRLRAVGFKIVLVPSAVVFHLEGSSSYSHREGVKYSSLRAFYVMRNHRLFIIKNYKFRTILIFLPCFLLYEIFNIGFSIKKQIFLKGYIFSLVATIKLFFPMLLKREEFQKQRKISDIFLVGAYKLDYNPGVIDNIVFRFFVESFEKFLYMYFKLAKIVLLRFP